MPITIGTTFWKCPVCKEESTVDGTDLAAVGTPFCSDCEDQEMEPLDDPIPTVLYVDNGRSKEYLGIALRSVETKVGDFKKSIAKLWDEFLSDKKRSKKFQDWLENEHNIIFLKSDCLVVNVGDTD
jgi:hypothetical protein